MKKFLIGLLLLAFILPAIAQNQDEYKFSLVPRRVAVPSLTGYLKDDGTTTLTADWNVGAFDLTAVDITGTGTITGAKFTVSSNGSAAAPVLNFTNCATSGFYVDPGTSANTVYLSIAGTLNTVFSQYYTGINSGTIRLGGAGGVYLAALTAAQLQLGEDAASPTDQTIKACDGSGTDKPGAMLTNQGGQSTGTGNPGGWRVQTSTIAGTGSTANTYYTRFHAVGKVYSLANNTATDTFSIALADGNGVGGFITYTVEVLDGTDVQVESGTVTFAAVNKAVETWTTDIDEVSTPALSGGTLATTWALDTATADTLKVKFTSNSSLTPTSTLLRYQITLNSPRAITIL
jgi:hypothetical protein